MKRFLVLLVIGSIFLNAFDTNQTIEVKPNYFEKMKIFLPKDAVALKSIIFIYQDRKGDINQSTVIVNKNILPNKPFIISHNSKSVSNKVLVKINLKDKQIYIRTKDELFRTFVLYNPFRIVLDFKRDVKFITINKDIKDNPYISKLVVGAHNNFYRISFYFKKKFNYKIKETKDGVMIELE